MAAQTQPTNIMTDLFIPLVGLFFILIAAVFLAPGWEKVALEWTLGLSMLVLARYIYLENQSHDLRRIPKNDDGDDSTRNGDTRRKGRRL